MFVRHPRDATKLLLGIAALSFFLAITEAQSQTKPAPSNEQLRKGAVDEKAIRALIAQLGDESFDKREAAQKSLARIGVPAFELVRKAAEESADLEVRSRAADLVRDIGELLFRVELKDKHWGDSVDPDGDCRFRVDPGQLYIRIPGKPHRLGIELGATNGPRVLRAVEGAFSAEVKVFGDFPSAKQSLVGKYPWYGSGLLIWQDDKNYIRLERARMDFSPNNRRCYINWELRREGKLERAGSGKDGLFNEAMPVFFKLARKENAFTATFSQDGKDWKDLLPIEAPFAKKLSVGVAAVQNTRSVFEAVFEGLRIASNKQ